MTARVGHHYEYEIQGNYGGEAGWELLTTEEIRVDAQRTLRDYNENEPLWPHRIRKVKVQA